MPTLFQLRTHSTAIYRQLRLRETTADSAIFFALIRGWGLRLQPRSRSTVVSRAKRLARETRSTEFCTSYEHSARCIKCYLFNTVNNHFPTLVDLPRPSEIEGRNIFQAVWSQERRSCPTWPQSHPGVLVSHVAEG